MRPYEQEFRGRELLEPPILRRSYCDLRQLLNGIPPSISSNARAESPHQFGTCEPSDGPGGNWLCWIFSAQPMKRAGPLRLSPQVPAHRHRARTSTPLGRTTSL
jgi:hypothetical protein